MSIERPGQRSIGKSTRLPVDGGTILQTTDNRTLVQAIRALIADRDTPATDPVPSISSGGSSRF
jgi:hypothetical protein